MLGTDGDRVRDPIEQVELLDADAVDLVEHVNDGNVTSTLCLENIDQVIDRRIASNSDISRVDLVSLHSDIS